MLQDTGFEITDENIEDSRWLLENEIPLTAENLESYQSLKDLRLPQDNEVVLKAITDAIAQENVRRMPFLRSPDSVS